MVANECGGFMRDGSSVDDYFPWGEKTVHHQLTGEFIRTIQAAKANGSNIRIEPPCYNDTSDDANYLNRLWKIHQSGALDSDKCISFKAAEYSYKKEKDRGDQAAFTFIKSLKHPAVPIFYLSTDREARDKASSLRTDVSVNKLPIFGLYYSLKEENLLPVIGLKNEVSSKDVYEHIYGVLNSHGLGKHRIPILQFDLAPGEDLDNQKQFPFRNSLAGLRQELNAKLSDYIPDEIPMEKPAEDRIAKFRAREQRRLQLLEQSGSRGK